MYSWGEGEFTPERHVHVSGLGSGPELPPQCKEKARVRGKCSKGRKPSRESRWSYDKKECVEFLYFGCGDTANSYNPKDHSNNNFKTKEVCERVCLVDSKGSGKILSNNESL